MKTVNSTLKTKLAEAQESLKSNQDLITYLNKQLNEKPSNSTGLISGTSTQSSFGNKLGGVQMSKPPLLSGGQATTSFKPSFTSIERLTGGAGSTTLPGPSPGAASGLTSLQRSSSRQSLERHQSPAASQRSMATTGTAAAGAPTNIPMSLAQSRLRNTQSPSTRSFTTTTIQEDSPGNPASGPATTKPPAQFVSKYTKMLYEQQQKMDAGQVINSSIP